MAINFAGGKPRLSRFPPVLLCHIYHPSSLPNRTSAVLNGLFVKSVGSQWDISFEKDPKFSEKYVQYPFNKVFTVHHSRQSLIVMLENANTPRWVSALRKFIGERPNMFVNRRRHIVTSIAELEVETISWEKLKQKRRDFRSLALLWLRSPGISLLDFTVLWPVSCELFLSVFWSDFLKCFPKWYYLSKVLYATNYTFDTSKVNDEAKLTVKTTRNECRCYVTTDGLLSKVYGTYTKIDSE